MAKILKFCIDCIWQGYIDEDEYKCPQCDCRVTKR